MQKLFLMGEKIFIGAETINPLQKVVLEELGVARQDNRTNRRARDLLCRGRVRPRRLGLSKVVDVVSNTNHADGQLARANYGRADTTPATVGRGDPTAPQSEDFLWDGLALIQPGDEQFVNEPHIGNAPQKLCFGGEPRAKRRARRARKGPRGNPVASSKGTSYFNDALGTTVGSKQGGKYSAAVLTAFGENLSVHSPTPTQNSNFFTGKPYVEGLGHAFLMRNYRAGLAKWQSADPMGYPDGWNQLAYCNNGVTSAVDLWGCEWLEANIHYLQKYDQFVVIPEGLPIDAGSISIGFWASVWNWICGVASETLVDYAQEIAWPLWERYKYYGSKEGSVMEDLTLEEAKSVARDRGYDGWEIVRIEFSTAYSDAEKIGNAIQIYNFDVLWNIVLRKWVE